MATLTKTMLSDLMKGNAAISLLTCPTDGKVTFSGLNFKDADQIFSIKDSFTLAPADPTVTNIQIDQFNEIIDTMIEEGEYVMNANIPTQATEVFDYFYNQGAEIASIKGQDGVDYEGQAYQGRKEVYASILVESESKKTAIAFARVRVVVLPPARDDNQNPAYLKFSGYISANLKEKEGNFAVLKAKKTEAPAEPAEPETKA